MIIKKYRKTTGAPVYVQSERWEDPEVTAMKQYHSNGRPVGDRSLMVERSELVDDIRECEGKGCEGC